MDICYILRCQEPDVDLGVDDLDRRDREQSARQAVKRLKALGDPVALSARA